MGPPPPSPVPERTGEQEAEVAGALAPEPHTIPIGLAFMQPRSPRDPLEPAPVTPEGPPPLVPAVHVPEDQEALTLGTLAPDPGSIWYGTQWPSRPCLPLTVGQVVSRYLAPDQDPNAPTSLQKVALRIYWNFKIV